MRPWNGVLPSPRARTWLLVPFLLTLSGCGKPSGTVTGTVSYRGENVPNAKVVFTGADFQTITTSTDAEGHYKAEKVPLGEMKVTVTTASAGAAGQAPKDPLGRNKAFVPPTEKSVAIPLIYGDPTSSRLNLEVKEGPQVFDIDLK